MSRSVRMIAKTSLIFLAPLLLATAAVAATDEGLRPGLPWVRFHSPDLQRPAAAGVDSQIDLDSGESIKGYSVRWVGLIRAPADGSINLAAEADDGLRLKIAGRTVIDGWGANAAREGAFTCRKGELSPLHIEYYQDGGRSHLRLYWSWAGQLKELIPPSAFFHTSEHQQQLKSVMGWNPPPARQDRSAIYAPDRGRAPAWTLPKRPVPAHPGPHLLIDDYLIESSRNVMREVMSPRRDPSIPNPIVTASGDRCFQPFFSVLRRPEDGRFRIWYGAWREDKNTSRSHLAYMESEDGARWTRPLQICTTPEIQFGSEVMDRGPDWTDRSTRYVYSYWLGGGLRIAVSPDGLAWRPLAEDVVLPHDHDITNVWFDPLRKRYVATVSTYMTSDRWLGRRRTTMQSYGGDLLNWTPPAYVLYADPPRDAGETQFYAMNGYLVRGPLVIGMVKVLRDDLKAEGVGRGAYGVGRTTLAWSRDGEHWERDLAEFFGPDPGVDAWDHAHVWIDEQLVVGDQVYLYYGGYKQGHKANRFAERQIGLIKMPLDRYVARRAGAEFGVLRTVPIQVNIRAGGLEINANADGGEIRVQVRDADSDIVVPGLDFRKCRPIRQNGLRLAVCWGDEELTRDKLAGLTGKPIKLEFELRRADLFAFDFRPGPP